MTENVLFLFASASLIVWGLAHLFATRAVVKDFGSISTDNRRIITMEWVIEGMALVFIGFLVLVLALFGQKDNPLEKLLFMMCAGMLLTLAVLSIFTGFRVRHLPFRLCPFIFTLAALLILAGIWS
jgi:high-affinity Fe2+/Pb2+ permease